MLNLFRITAAVRDRDYRLLPTLTHDWNAEVHGLLRGRRESNALLWFWRPLGRHVLVPMKGRTVRSLRTLPCRSLCWWSWRTWDYQRGPKGRPEIFSCFAVSGHDGVSAATLNEAVPRSISSASW